jgi:hypothetical protein
MRDLLVDTGVPQGAGGHIGPIPDLEAALALLLTLPDCRYGESGSPGEAADLRVQSVSQTTGEMAISWAPACATAGHTLVYGRLGQVAGYDYSGQVCDIGDTGAHAGLVLGPESYFFLVVAHDGAGFEGSYGRNSAGQERPEDLDDPVCSLEQMLVDRCD